MIRAYSKDALETAKRKLGEMFEIAVDFENIDIDEFASVFVSNADVVRSFETASPIILEGKSSSEILSLLVERKHTEYELPEEATPEYWMGACLCAVVQRIEFQPHSLNLSSINSQRLLFPIS